MFTTIPTNITIAIIEIMEMVIPVITSPIETPMTVDEPGEIGNPQLAKPNSLLETSRSPSRRHSGPPRRPPTTQPAAAAAEAETATKTGRQMTLFYLKYAQADDVVDPISVLTPEVRFSIDSRLNALLVYATKEDAAAPRAENPRSLFPAEPAMSTRRHPRPSAGACQPGMMPG